MFFYLYAEKVETNKIARSFTVTPDLLAIGYLERKFNSNEMQKHFPLSMMQLMSKGFDAAVNSVNNRWLSWSIGIAYSAPSIFLAYLSTITYHEYGHARAKFATGIDYSFYGMSDNSVTTDTFLGMYLQGVLHPFQFSFSEGVTSYKNGKNTPGVSKQNDGYCSFAGMNNQMRLAKEVSQLIYKNNGHLLYAMDYFLAKTEPIRYVGWFRSCKEDGTMSAANDINTILNYYSNYNISITDTDILVGDTLATCLSSTSWAFVRALITQLPYDKFLVEPLVWKGFRFPDFNFYMTTQGLSMEMVTGYQINPRWYVGLEAEMVYKGNHIYELRPTVQHTLPTKIGTFDLEGQMIVSHGLMAKNWSDDFKQEDAQTHFGGKASVGYTFWKDRLTVKGYYIYHNLLTLLGERNIPFIHKDFIEGRKARTGDHEVGVTLSYNYY